MFIEFAIIHHFNKKDTLWGLVLSENNQQDTEDTPKVDISPEVSMYNILKDHAYSLGGALSEYIDNSLQSFMDNKEKLNTQKLKITIKIDDKDIHNKQIVIEDNAAGISHKDLNRAMKPAYKPEEQSLNEFGIGMKAASLWIGRTWTLSNNYLHRKNKDETEQIIFDLDKLIKNNQTSIPITYVPNKTKKHGVIITIEKLNRVFDREQVEDAFLTLEENYQYFIHTMKILELHLVSTQYNNLASVSKEDISTPKALKSRKMILKKNKPYWCGKEVKVWRQEVNFMFNEKPVTGFVLCREESTHKNPGLKYFREKRLIQGTSRKDNRPIHLLKTPNKHDSLRFYAELHLDGQTISNNKDMLDINEKQFLDKLKAQEGVEEILEQAKSYRPRAVENNDVKECDEENSTKTNSSEHKDNSPKTNVTSKNISKSNQVNPIDILDLVINNTKDLVIKSIADEAKKLYEKSVLGFLFCYRPIMEKMIQEKIKNIIPAEQYKKDDIANRSINKLITWLNTNKKTLNFEGEWQSVQRNLHHFDNNKTFDVTNIIIHAHYHPTPKDVDDILINSQKLLEWAVSQE